MTVLFYQGEPKVAPNRPVESYRLYMKSMIGDADGYNQNQLTFSAKSDIQSNHLRHILQVLDAYAHLAWNAQCDVDRRAWEALSEAVLGESVDSHDDVVEDISELVGHEPYEGRLASPDRWELTYFDENSVEYTVVAKATDGRVLQMCR